MSLLVKDVAVVMTPGSLATVYNDAGELIFCRLFFVFAFVNVCDFSFEFREAGN